MCCPQLRGLQFKFPVDLLRNRLGAESQSLPGGCDSGATTAGTRGTRIRGSQCSAGAWPGREGKFRSCLTLFGFVDPSDVVFRVALDKFYL